MPTPAIRSSLAATAAACITALATASAHAQLRDQLIDSFETDQSAWTFNQFSTPGDFAVLADGQTAPGTGASVTSTDGNNALVLSLTPTTFGSGEFFRMSQTIDLFPRIEDARADRALIFEFDIRAFSTGAQNFVVRPFVTLRDDQGDFLGSFTAPNIFLAAPPDGTNYPGGGALVEFTASGFNEIRFDDRPQNGTTLDIRLTFADYLPGFDSTNFYNAPVDIIIDNIRIREVALTPTDPVVTEDRFPIVEIPQGESRTLSPAITDPDNNFQWFKDSQPLVETAAAIGTNAATLTLTGTPSNHGFYQLEETRATDTPLAALSEPIFVAIRPAETNPADINNDQTIDVFDLIAFLQAFSAALSG